MDPIESIQFDPCQRTEPSPERKKAPAGKSEKPIPSPPVRIELGTEYQSFVQKALQQTEPLHSQVILEARQALEQGQLDTPEAARLAAQAILRFGI